MSKRKASTTRDFENPMTGEGSRRGKGVFGTLLVLSLVGLVIWLVVNNQES